MLKNMKINKYRALDPNTGEYTYFEIGKLWNNILATHYHMLVIMNARFEQYINKCDKNGKAIYEGDKHIETLSIKGKKVDVMCTVVFHVGEFMGKWEYGAESGYLPIFGNTMETIQPTVDINMKGVKRYETERS